MSEPSYKELKKAFPDGSMIRFKERRIKECSELCMCVECLG